MKKIAFFMSALALLAFVSCEEKEGDDVDLNTVTEDGFYVSGAATGATELSGDYMMTAGLNEAASNAKRDGMYEKYIALEAGKDFELVLYKAGVTTRYSAVLEDLNTEGLNDQPTVTLKRGALVTGAEAKAMQVDSSALYHIVLDLNNAKDLENPQIIVAPVSWGVRGINGDWGWKEMKSSAFNHETMTWTIGFETVKNAKFKFAYGGGWKIALDLAGNVKANTNLGEGMINGGADIPTGAAYEDATITLTWKLAGGEIKNGYEWKINGKEVVVDASTIVVGLSGSCLPEEAGSWADPQGPSLAVYNAEKSEITDAAKYVGKYVYDIKDLAIAAGEFKVRVNGEWIGTKAATVEGIEFTGDDNFVVAEAAAGTYDIEFTIDWNGSAADSIKAVFTKK